MRSNLSEITTGKLKAMTDASNAATDTAATADGPSDDVVARVLASAESALIRLLAVLQSGAQALQADGRRRQRRTTASSSTARTARRCAAFPGLSTELEDVTEVEYRQLRLENVVLIGVYTQGTQDDAENSMRETGRAGRDRRRHGARRPAAAPRRTPTPAPTSVEARLPSSPRSCRRSAPTP